jgi:hypothetical protein
MLNTVGIVYSKSYVYIVPIIQNNIYILPNFVLYGGCAEIGWKLGK